MPVQSVADIDQQADHTTSQTGADLKAEAILVGAVALGEREREKLRLDSDFSRIQVWVAELGQLIDFELQ